MDAATHEYMSSVIKSVFLDWTQQCSSELYSEAERRYDAWMQHTKAAIWDEATEAQADWEWLAERAREGSTPDPLENNPYRET